MSNFGDPQYWDNRYSAEEGKRYEWLENLESVKQLLYPCMIKGKQTNILHVGCGNSQIQDQLYEEGYHHITNNDISTVVIKQMKLTNKYPELIYDVMDVTDMRYPDKSFDMVLDKSVIDALLCSDAPYSNAAKMLHHIHRVLSDDGYYFAILYGRPEQRMIYLKQKHVNFDITVTELKGKTGQPSHYIYACKKLPMQYDQKIYKQLIKKLEQQQQEQFQKLNN